MKKSNFKKLGIISMIFVMIATFMFGLTDMNAKSTAPASFNADSEKRLAGYIANYQFGKKTNSKGGYVYCNDIHKGTPHGEVMKLVGEASPGIAYIISHGYPTQKITGNSDYDYYITQAAVWWYLDDTTGSNNLSASFKTNGSDPKGLRKYVKALVEAAKKVNGYAKPSLAINNKDNSMSLSSDKKYYESNAISVTAKLVSGNYTVSLKNAPSGTIVVNAKTGKQATTFATNESFKVRIPVNNVTELKTSININVKAEGAVNKAYEYKSTDTSVQNVYGSALYPDTVNLAANTTVTLSTSKVSIVKIDSKTQVALAGAEFTLYNSNGNKITSWTSSSKYHVIKNLPNGTYTLKETKAPKGYKVLKESINITISDTNRDITLKVANEAITKLVHIVKIDKATGQPLAGAHLVVKNEKGEVIADFVSTTEPYTLTELADGKYSVYEVDAPEGYKKSEATYYFTISDGEPVASVTIDNEKETPVTPEQPETPKEEEVIVPNTDDNNPLFPTLLGAVSLLSGIGFVYYNGKKQEI